jgi:uncharacterized Zn finger protein
MGYYGWKPYVSVAKRRELAEKVSTKAKKAGADYAPVLASRGAIAKTFWGKAWCDNLERYSDFESRLPRGRTYMRNGSIIDLQLSAGKISAKVMGSELYDVSATITPVAAAKWQAIIQDCSGSIDSVVALLQGKLSQAVMERMCVPGTGLFPAPTEIKFKCSCPDWAGMCKHVAAAFYGIGARLDAQPELLFQLRQVDAKDLISHASVDLAQPTKALSKGKRLDDALLGDVFGLDMAGAASATPLAAKPIKPIKPIKPTKPAKKTSVAVKSPKAVSKKAAAKTVTTEKPVPPPSLAPKRRAAI